MRFAFAAVALLAVPAAACSFHWNGDDDSVPGVAATGTGTTRTYPITNFDSVELRGSDDVDVRVGTGFSVRAEGPSDQLDRLKIERDGMTLKVGRQKGVNVGWSKHDPVKIYVTLPRMAGAGVAGSGTMTVDRIEGGRFAGGIAGSGNLIIAAMKVEDAKLSVAGSGSMQTAGTARMLNIDIAGSGNVAAKGLRATGAKVSIAGSGDVAANVAGPAAVSIMGSGDVDLGPAARCQTSKMGSGSVRCGG